MNDDLLELLNSLKSHGVEFLIIGAHAVGFHARPRMTQDVDLWVGPSRDNADRLRQAMDEFGAPIGKDGAKRFCELERQMIRLGVPPNMVDILNFAVARRPFDDVYAHRVLGTLDEVELFFPAVEDLIEIKSAAGRKARSGGH